MSEGVRTMTVSTIIRETETTLDEGAGWGNFEIAGCPDCGQDMVRTTNGEWAYCPTCCDEVVGVEQYLGWQYDGGSDEWVRIRP